MRRAFFLSCLAPLVLLACGDENALDTDSTFTGLWRSDGLAGTTLLFELEQAGPSLTGNLYALTQTGEVGAPSPLRFGEAEGERLFFSPDFSGGEFAGMPIDTMSFRGTRQSADVLSMSFYVCAGDSCATVPFLAVREPSGF